MNCDNIGNVSNINMFQSLWLSVKRDMCEEGFWKKAKRGLDRMTHYWTKVTNRCLDKVVQTKAKCMTKGR